MKATKKLREFKTISPARADRVDEAPVGNAAASALSHQAWLIAVAAVYWLIGK
jgi:hypothetical protein